MYNRNIMNLKIPINCFEMSSCEISKEDTHNGRKYLYISLKHSGGTTQSYPAIFGTDEQLADIKNNLCKVFEITKVEELIGKNLWSIGGFNSIFGLVNPDNLKIFSFANTYSISNYLEDLKTYKYLPEYKHINLIDEDLINLICLNESSKKLDPLLNNNFKIINDVKKYMLYYSLDSQLDIDKVQKAKIKL